MTDIQSKPIQQRVGVIPGLVEDRASDKWHRVEFDPPFHPSLTVVVIPMTQTYLGSGTPGLRIRNVSQDSFEIRFDEAVVHRGDHDYSADGRHADREVVGWVAYAFAG
jgi:hypothetical protein